ncbi:MAG: GNAT family N-acetyltransferase [Coriobacteriia bacterium]|nr:GNAT family N-acetyltransferase [Coriobacteriia bacterium]
MDTPAHTAPLVDGLPIVVLDGADPLMRQVADLCYETLHRPFGVSRSDAWDEMDPASTHLAVIDAGRLAGYARLIVEGPWAHLRQVVVAPEHRRRGIATAVINTAVDTARARGLEGAYLNARYAAVPLYERLGFRVVSEGFRMPRTWLPHVRMEQHLR